MIKPIAILIIIIPFISSIHSQTRPGGHNVEIESYEYYENKLKKKHIIDEEFILNHQNLEKLAIKFINKQLLNCLNRKMNFSNLFDFYLNNLITKSKADIKNNSCPPSLLPEIYGDKSENNSSLEPCIYNEDVKAILFLWLNTDGLKEYLIKTYRIDEKDATNIITFYMEKINE